MASGSKIFRRNRSLGYVSNQVPAVIRYVKRRKEHIIVTCIGRCFQVYTSGHFRLTHVSNTHPDEITCIAIDKYYTYTASDKCIFAWRAGKHILHTYKGHSRNVHLLLPFNDQLVAVDRANIIKVWNIASEEVHLEIPFSSDEFLITAIAHPPTYINKIIIGSQQGRLKILNIKDSRLIYTFAGYSSKVTCLETAPAIDVIAVGHQDGTVILLNMKYDEVIMELKQDWGSVTEITFRTDNQPIMATASSNGHIAFWNLEEKRISSQIQAHEDAVTTLICFPCEPLMLTTSPDNSMKLWAFDMPDGGARLLRERNGHTAPPLCIRYHGSRGVSILSSGEDSSMRIFSTVSETLNRSMGKASYNRKASKKKNRFGIDNFQMPPITNFTSETTREKEWDSIAAIHSGLVQVTTWSFDKCRMGEHHLVPEQFQNKNRKDFKTEATCLALTHCGNFVVIGYSNGSIERFNIQSGIHRATYGTPKGHEFAVRGIACDNLNQAVISACSEGLVKFWNFKGNVKKPIFQVNTPDGVSIMRSHRESAMLAIALENFSICILDTDTRIIVRSFEGHTGKINDIAFSPDSRWLLTAAMDSTIKIWDIPSSYMVDHFKVERPCISLCMSPTGDFLATAHVNHLGVFLWANKMLFTQISLRSINPFDEAPFIDLPSNVRDEVGIESDLADLNVDSDDEGEEINLKYISPSQLSDDLITLSGLAQSRWHNLLDLDIIKKRNKPKAPPKVPKQAPFFLPTIAGLEFKFDTSVAADENEENSRVLIPTDFKNLTEFGKLLEETQETIDYDKAIDYLKKLGPSMIDFELKSLHPMGGGSYKAMLQFLKSIEFMFKSNKDFELCQAYLSAFLQAHGLALTEKPELVSALKLVEEAQNRTWKSLEDKFLYCLGVVSALRNYSLSTNFAS